MAGDLWSSDLVEFRHNQRVATRLLVGDLNATLDHQPLRAPFHTGYRDAADVLGRGLRATWPADTALARFRDRHRAVVADLVMPDRTPDTGQRESR